MPKVLSIHCCQCAAAPRRFRKVYEHSAATRSADQIRKFVFLGVLAVPLLLIAVKRDPAFPLPKSLGECFFFPEEFKHYVANDLPLRNDFARIHNRALLAVNGPSEVGKVIVGKKGWMFLRIGRDMRDHGFDHHDLSALREKHEQRAQICRELGIKYRVLFVPSKENLYSEYLPDRFQGWVSTNESVSQVGRFLSTKSVLIPTVDVLARFQSAKKVSDLYFHTDSHWNEFGGFIATEELMRSLSPSYEGARYRIEMRKSIGGNEAQILGVQDQVTENYPRVVVHDGRQPTMANGKPIAMDTINLNTFDLKGTRTICPDAPFKSVVVYHNSFGVALLPFISRHFQKSLFMWHHFVEEQVRAERPQVVVDLVTTF